jgi:hypothetical protein
VHWVAVRHEAQPVAHRMQSVFEEAYVPVGQDRQVLILVERHVVHPSRHCPQVSTLILVKPVAQPPISQYPGPAVSHVKQFLAHALHVPFALGANPGLHLTQN